MRLGIKKYSIPQNCRARDLKSFAYEHNDGYLTTKKGFGYVYCVVFSNNILKVGVSNSPFWRLIALMYEAKKVNVEKPTTIYVSKKLKNHFAVERRIHKALSNYRVIRREYYKCNIEQFLELENKHLRKS